MFVARYKHRIPSGREITSRLLAIWIAISFIATVVPIASASWEKSGVMACCIGKEAGHCDSGLTGHRYPPPPPPEPMCGLTSTSLDSITIVAEPATKSHNSRHSAESPSSLAGAESQAGGNSQTDAETRVTAESPSIHKPCQMSCGACTARASRLQKRQKDIIQAKTSHVFASGAILRFENLPRVFSSDQSWTHISPRGPPATSL
jgi:hypothetical protein